MYGDECKNYMTNVDEIILTVDKYKFIQQTR